jgi:RND family efflux transporter MFP subunit
MGAHLKTAAPDLGSLRIDEHSRRAAKVVKWPGWFAAGLAALAILGVLALLFFKNYRPVVEAAAVLPAGAQPTGAVLRANGYVTPRIRATIAAKITGRLAAVYVDEGMHVAQNQLLATLDDSDARVRLSSAKADREASKAAIPDLTVRLANAERELTRVSALQAYGIETAQKLDTAQTTVASLRAQTTLAGEQVKASQARIDVAQQDLDNAAIRAPFAGMVVSKDAQVGEIISPVSAGGGFTRTGIATIVDMKSLEIEVDVNESYIAVVQPGQRTIAILDAYPDWQIPSHVRTVIPTADRQRATVKVRISFDQLDPRILPDMGVKVIFLNEEKLGANPNVKDSEPKMLIPQSAVRQEKGDYSVFLVRDGKVERRAVSLGGEQGNDVEVLAGLSPGDMLVVRGPDTLHKGEAVEVKP